MPGKILKILVNNGDQVKSGDILVIMESMKMESKIVANKNGKIKLNIKQGDVVQGKSLLLTIE